MLTIAPLCCARRCGSAAWMTASAPKKLVSIWARNSVSGVSSTAPMMPNPTLLMMTSMRPKRRIDAAIACCASPGAVTSSLCTRTRLGARAANAPSLSIERAVATTLYPRPSAKDAKAIPNPEEAPVMNQVVVVMLLLSEIFARSGKWKALERYHITRYSVTIQSQDRRPSRLRAEAYLPLQFASRSHRLRAPSQGSIGSVDDATYRLNAPVMGHSVPASSCTFGRQRTLRG